MTNNEIVEMAIQGHSSTRDAIRWAIEFVQEQARLDGIHTCHDKCERPACVAVREAVIAERQACAKVCENMDVKYEGHFVRARLISEAIRARGQQ